MIINGCDKSITVASSLPNMSDALTNWFQTMTISVVTKTVVNHVLTEVETVKNIMAVKQPFTSKQLMIKPEGQRAWSWEWLHVRSEDLFANDDIVRIGAKKYRIMNKWDFVEYGYNSYEIIQDYT